MFRKIILPTVATAILHGCGSVPAVDGDEIGVTASPSYPARSQALNDDRTLADDVGAKLVKASFIAATCADSNLVVPGFATLTGQRKSVSVCRKFKHTCPSTPAHRPKPHHTPFTVIGQ